MGSEQQQIVRRSAILGTFGALTLASVALAASTHYYNGTTSQKFGSRPDVINLSVSHNKVTGIDFAAVFPNCENTDQPINISPYNGFHGFAIRHGSFSGHEVFYNQNGNKTLQISGHVNRNEVSGTLSVTFVSCSTGRVTYKAKEASGPSL